MLLDTSGLLGLFDRRERHHVQAVERYHVARNRLVHNYVLAEFVALAHARHAPRALALEFTASLLTNSKVEIIWVGESLHQAALALLQQRLDKEWSLCDAVSVLLMQQRGFTEALTTDHHFEQAGFVRLLKP
ncbi:MAG: type II toxin-antitoxin system VapC family toxin [Pyrinomonadaceae bacterium]